MYAKYIKRLLDFILALCALIVFTIPMLVIAFVIKINLGSPVLYTAARIGRDEKPFKMYKFRSMTNERDENGELLPDTDRLTRLGRFLRASSIDELPALINVIKGNMALIGPRPLPMIYLPYFYEEERQRHSVRGGLSGLAQINGRNSVSWDQKFRYDIEYVNSITFLRDIEILFKTLIKVFQHSDIGIRGVSAPEDLNICRKPNSKYITTRT